MAHHVANGLTAVGELHVQAAHGEDAAGPGSLLGQRVLCEGGITRVIVSADEVAALGLAARVVVRGAVAVVGECLGRIEHVCRGGVRLGHAGASLGCGGDVDMIAVGA